VSKSHPKEVSKSHPQAIIDALIDGDMKVLELQEHGLHLE
jgi:hypothetical protein